MNNTERLLEAAQLADSAERRADKLKENPAMPDATTEIARALKEIARALHCVASSIPR